LPASGFAAILSPIFKNSSSLLLILLAP